MNGTENVTSGKTPRKGPFLIGLLVLLGILGFFLWTEHRAHLLEYLPWIILLLCPLHHLFMHRGHGHRHGSHDNARHDHSDHEKDAGS